MEYMHITTLYHHQLLNKLQPVIQPNPSNSVVTQHNETSVIVYAFKQDHIHILNFKLCMPPFSCCYSYIFRNPPGHKMYWTDPNQNFATELSVLKSVRVNEGYKMNPHFVK